MAGGVRGIKKDVNCEDVHFLRSLYQHLKLHIPIEHNVYTISYKHMSHNCAHKLERRFFPVRVFYLIERFKHDKRVFFNLIQLLNGTPPLDIHIDRWRLSYDIHPCRINLVKKKHVTFNMINCKVSL